jgi:hypothetical protein
MPKSGKEPDLIHGEDGYYLYADALTYRVTGLTPFDLCRLRITLKVNRKEDASLFHIDTLDMYQARCRQAFVDDCKKRLNLVDPTIVNDMHQLIALLEQERIKMQDEKPRDNQPMKEGEKKQAMRVLEDKNLMDIIARDFEKMGLVGEVKNKQLGYLASISRLLPEPLGILIISRSGAGKTVLQDAVCKFIPPESVIQYTRLTAQSLFYRDKNALKNKVLSIEEEEGLEHALYSIRVLQSSQKLAIASTRTDPQTGKLYTEEHVVYGPTSIFVTTTNPEALDPETRQRFLILTIDESSEQTKKILEIQREMDSLEWYKNTVADPTITRLHHNMQRLLEPLTVIIPESVRFEYPYSRLQMRREQKKFRSLIKAITLLHQYQRERGKLARKDDSVVDFVKATQKDVEMAFDLGREVLSRSLDDVSPTGRILLSEIKKHVEEKYKQEKAKNPEMQMSEVSFNRKELRDRIGWSEGQVRQNIAPLVDLGYLEALSGRQGAAYQYALIDDGENDPKIKL